MKDDKKYSQEELDLITEAILLDQFLRNADEDSIYFASIEKLEELNRVMESIIESVKRTLHVGNPEDFLDGEGYKWAKNLLFVLEPEDSIFHAVQQIVTVARRSYEAQGEEGLLACLERMGTHPDGDYDIREVILKKL